MKNMAAKNKTNFLISLPKMDPALCQRISWKVQRIKSIRWKGLARTLLGMTSIFVFNFVMPTEHDFI